ncbi:MAG: carbamoyltransferase HypF [Elusimicrobium sp.]|jgi:hydrogenase maturation protein HypF|nr:carbamoyltransferase HypF [Elusimicrobium sp.]
MLRQKLIVTGVIQGVGFRPFVYKAARKLGLTGFVRNTSRGVEIEAQGKNAGSLQNYIYKYVPPQASIENIKIAPLKIKKEKEFKILISKKYDAQSALLPPDLALCKNCAKEILDTQNRRYNYPLTNCTDCGPRVSITAALPYDRKNTTMNKFKMCPSCAAEYNDPLSRRFHAQPNCCPVCGPQVFFEGEKGEKALKKAARFIDGGKIIALKSIGGYHLACDAKNFKAVTLLRRRKNRPHKPFALMFNDLKTAKKYCRVTPLAAKYLKSSAAPIVMARKKITLRGVADNLNNYGVMLAYTPLHKILFSMLKTDALVMTSGNAAGGALCSLDNEARAKLKNIADGFLFHNREIYNKLDDSVMFEALGKMRFIRRARGYAPRPLTLARRSAKTVCGLGANKTAAACFIDGNKAYLTQYTGNLDKEENRKFYLDAAAKTQKLFSLKPKIFARDLHPDYFTSQLKPSARAVQHHAAHALSVEAEHNLKGKYLGIIFDGMGLGDDGAVWGGEFLVFNNKKYSRAGTFESILLPGGDISVKEIWRLGLGITGNAHDNLFKGINKNDVETALAQIKAGINCPKCGSVGRLFDAAAFLCGLRQTVTYQAQAAMELEAKFTAPAKPYPVKIEKRGGVYTVLTKPAFEEILRRREDAQTVSNRFHSFIIKAAAETAGKIGVKQVVLSGGVFQNKILLEGIYNALTKAGFKVYLNEQVSCNDSGLALGQAYYLL